MNKKSLTKKLAAILLSCAMAFSVMVPASAQTIEPQKNGVSVSTDASVQPRSFVYTYESYLTSSALFIMRDDNWWGEPNVSVALTSTSGPSSVTVICYDHNGDWVGTRTINLNSSAYFSIPKGAFSIYAYKSGGNNGNVGMSVSLSW